MTEALTGGSEGENSQQRPRRLSPEDIERGIREHIREGRLKFNLRTGAWIWRTKPLDPRTLANRLVATIDASENRIASVLNNMADDEDLNAKLRVQAWVKSIDARGMDERPMRRWLTLMTGLRDDEWIYNAYLWMMKQWVWQIKRNILEKKVTWHIVPIFWSRAQGTGKSTNVARLFEPLKEYARTMEVDKLTADFMTAILGRSYVVFFEELAGVDGVAMAALKARVSADVYEGRRMYSDTVESVRASCSFIATTNDPPPHGLGDESGGRRFAPIACSDTPMNADSDRAKALDEIDPGSLWRCVTAAARCPTEEMPRSLYRRWDEYRAEKFRVRTPIESFIEERLVEETDGAMKMGDVHEAFTNFCRQTQQPKPKNCTFRRLADMLRAQGCRVTNGQNRLLLRGYQLRHDDDYAMEDLPRRGGADSVKGAALASAVPFARPG